MKIELLHSDDYPTDLDGQPCEICEQLREGLAALLVVKQLGAEPAHVDFKICWVCAGKIALLVTRHHLALDQQRAPPPPAKRAGGGGS